MQRASRRKKYKLLRLARVLCQLFSLLLFFFLFIKTDYSGADEIEYAVNILFRIDPLLAICTIIGAKAIIVLMLPAAAVLASTLVIGRSFCGWVCPMGSLLDLFHPLLRSKNERKPTLYPRLSLIILLFICLSALFQLPLAGYLDPFSILVRVMVQALHPVLNSASTSFFSFTYSSAPEFVNNLTEPVYSFLKQTILPSEQKHFYLVLPSVIIFAAVFLSELVQRRFFCRNICPLGALLGLFSRLGVFAVIGGNDKCGLCRQCSDICRMGAVEESRMINSSSCILCMDCFEQCPRQVIKFYYRPVFLNQTTISLSRRQFFTTMAAGVVLPTVLAGARQEHYEPKLIRPPGALTEKEFLQRCVRCAECMQVCLTNGLQPTFLDSGIEGIFTPRLVPRIGYCEYNCTLCGQVCPSGAIKILTMEQKHSTKIGHAWIDKNICLPFAKGIPCIVCEEHCPTPDKAIKFREVKAINAWKEKIVLKQPYIIDDLCIGCGICETRCPLPDRSAIYITRAGESRDEMNILPERIR